MPNIKKQCCPTCGQSVNEREIHLFTGMVTCLYKVVRWCEANGVHEFKKKDIKHLLTDVVSANFAYWRWFGGLVYNPDGIQGHYGLNMQRCRDFLGGKLQIPTVLYKNPLVTDDEKAIRPGGYGYIHEIPILSTFLNEEGEYIARYRDPQSSLF